MKFGEKIMEPRRIKQLGPCAVAYRVFSEA
jgi:hypothetical protein